jgi:hypothetical protein
MALVGTNSGGSSNFTPHPTGGFAARLIDVIDLGVLKSEFQGKVKMQHKMAWRFFAGQEEDGKPLYVTQRLTLSTHEKAKARALLESALGRRLTPKEGGGFDPALGRELKDDEVEGFDYESLIGSGFLISVSHNVTPKGTFANLSSVMPLLAGMECPDAPENYVREINRPADKSKDVRAKSGLPSSVPTGKPVPSKSQVPVPEPVPDRDVKYPETDHDTALPWE